MVYVSKGLLTPVMPDPAEKSLGVNLVEFELLELIVGWQHLYLSIFKAVLRLYGLAPSGPPQALHAGPTSDERLCEENGELACFDFYGRKQFCILPTTPEGEGKQALSFYAGLGS